MNVCVCNTCDKRRGGGGCRRDIKQGAEETLTEMKREPEQRGDEDEENGRRDVPEQHSCSQTDADGSFTDTVMLNGQTDAQFCLTNCVT